MDELKTAVGPLGGSGQKVQGDLYVAGGQCVGELLQPLHVELEILVHRPLVTGRPDRGMAAVGPERVADVQKQPKTNQIGREVLLVARPANGQFKTANPDLGTAQVAASLDDAAGLGTPEDLVDVDLQPLKPMG